MSTALGIAAVTAVLESMLNSVFNPGAGLGSVLVSAYAPDVVQAGIDAGSTNPQVNLFLHQVRHNAAWRNVDLPSLAPDGTTRLKNPPLALDLHYLLTAYTPEDGFAEALLGYALLMLHQYPILSRDQVTSALSALSTSHPLYTALQSAGLADQIELLKITPETLGREEMAWIWTALKADYRPTYAFQVTVVLLQPPATVSSPLPVFVRNIKIQPGPPPLLLEVQVPANQASAAAGDTVTLVGQSLSGANAIALTNQRFGFRYQPLITPSAVGATAVSFVVPNDPANLPAGLYTVAALFTDAGGNILQSTNALGLGIAPTIVMAPPPTITQGAPGTTVTLNCTPEAQPAQMISLAMGGAAVPPLPFTAITPTLSFLFAAPGLSSGSYVIRLQVDGVDSAVSWSAMPAPHFTSPIVMVP
jgi:Pvc16 N-terminal domain